MEQERRARLRTYAYLAVIGVAVAAWVPYIAAPISQWNRQRYERNTIALLYTTDTRGFLESCG